MALRVLFEVCSVWRSGLAAGICASKRLVFSLRCHSGQEGAMVFSVVD